MAPNRAQPAHRRPPSPPPLTACHWDAPDDVSFVGLDNHEPGLDGETLARAQVAGLDIGAELANHNSSAVLGRLDDLIVTGVRGTNVRDLRLIYVGGGNRERAG